LENKFVNINIISATKRNFLPAKMILPIVADAVSSLLPWSVVLGPEDILEHLDIVQVSDKTRESVYSDNCWENIFMVYNIYIFRGI
jgi:hypothetical protein